MEELLRGIVEAGVLARSGDGKDSTMVGDPCPHPPTTVVHSVSDRSRRLGLLEPVLTSPASPGWYRFRTALTAEALSSNLLPTERAAIPAAEVDAIQAW